MYNNSHLLSGQKSNTSVFQCVECFGIGKEGFWFVENTEDIENNFYLGSLKIDWVSPDPPKTRFRYPAVT